MNLSDLLTTLWSALRGNIGGGHDFVVVYTALGAILWAFLLFKIFLQEGIQVATGHGTELPKILVKYLFVAAMFAVWPQAANSIFSAIKTLATMFYPSLNGLLDTMAGSMNVMGGGQQAASNSQGLVSTVLGTVYNFTIGSLFVGIGTIILFLCYALIMINIAGSLTILAMNLVLGPVFFALAFDRDFRSHAQHWFAAVLSYFMLIPLYGAALDGRGGYCRRCYSRKSLWNAFGRPGRRAAHRSAYVGRRGFLNKQSCQCTGWRSSGIGTGIDGTGSCRSWRQPSSRWRHCSFHGRGRQIGNKCRHQRRQGSRLQNQFYGTSRPGQIEENLCQLQLTTSYVQAAIWLTSTPG